MADGTKIEWTEATWNPVTGCSVLSPGCTNCYAMKLAGTRLRRHPSRAGLTRDSKAGPVWNGQVRFNEQWLDQPLRWRRPRMIFVCAHGDLFHDSVPDDWIDRVFAVMALAPQHTFQVLTKRSARMREYLTADDVQARVFGAACDLNRSIGFKVQRTVWFGGDEDAPLLPLPNCWLGVSVEDQQRADERVPDLLATPAAVRWLSCEPLLDHVAVFDMDGPIDVPDGIQSPLHWIVAGGESGPGARPMHPDWARSLRDQCSAADVPFFFKQWGGWFPTDTCDHPVWDRPHCSAHGVIYYRLGKKAAGRRLDGVEHSGMPADG